MTVLELLEKTTRYFESNQVSSPRLTIELMLAHALEKTRLQLYLEFDKLVPEPVLDRLRPLVKRRAEGEPLEYLLGTTTFAGHRVQVSPAVLIPRPDTEILLEAAIKRIEPAGLPVLDVGTGSGILALALGKKFPDLEIWAVEIDEKALEQARANTASEPKVHAVPSDLLANSGLPPKFQMIVANLPYIPTAQIEQLPREVRHEPRLALDGGPDGLALIARLISEAAGRTRFLALEIGDGQAAAAKTLCERAGYGILDLLPDMSQRDRVVVAEHHG